MKNIKKLSIVLTGLILFLGGCGSNRHVKNDQEKSKRLDSEKSSLVSSTVSKKSLIYSSSNVAFGQKISNDEFYVMAYAKNEHITLDKLLSGSKSWVFPSANIKKPGYAFCKEDNYNCIGDSSGSNEGETRLISVGSNNVTIAHLESTAPKQDHAEFTYQNLTFSKKDLIKQFLTSKDQVNKLVEITENMKKNENQATKDIAQEDASSSSDQDTKVDTKNLTTQQVCDWIKDYCHSDGSNIDVDPQEIGTPLDHDGYAVFEVWVTNDSGNKQLAGDCYRIDKNGNLQEAARTAIDDMNSDQWQNTNFSYPGN